MGKRFLASVANVELFAKQNGKLEHFASAKTLTDSSIGFTLSMEEVRAGQGAKLYGRFGHTSGMTLSMVDAMFNIEYFKKLLGSEATATEVARVMTEERITHNDTATLNALTGKIKKLGSLSGLDEFVAWYHYVGEEEDKPLALTISQGAISAITAPADFGTKDICVKYFHEESSTELIKVNANFIPAEFVAVMTAQEFAGDASAPETGKPVGEFIVKLPRFQLDGQFDLALNMTSAASVSLNGTALAVEDYNDCEGNSYYAEIIEKLYSTDWRTGLTDIIADVAYNKVGDTPHIYGVYGSQIKLLSNSEINAQETGAASPVSGFSTGAYTASTDKWAQAGNVTITIYSATGTSVLTEAITVVSAD